MALAFASCDSTQGSLESIESGFDKFEAVPVTLTAAEATAYNQIAIAGRVGTVTGLLEAGVVVSQEADPTNGKYTKGKVDQDGILTATAKKLSGLTTYYVWAYTLTNDQKYSYSEPMQVTTPEEPVKGIYIREATMLTPLGNVDSKLVMNFDGTYTFKAFAGESGYDLTIKLLDDEGNFSVVDPVDTDGSYVLVETGLASAPYAWIYTGGGGYNALYPTYGEFWAYVEFVDNDGYTVDDGAGYLEMYWADPVQSYESGVYDVFASDGETVETEYKNTYLCVVTDTTTQETYYSLNNIYDAGITYNFTISADGTVKGYNVDADAYYDYVETGFSSEEGSTLRIYRAYSYADLDEGYIYYYKYLLDDDYNTISASYDEFDFGPALESAAKKAAAAKAATRKVAKKNSAPSQRPSALKK